MNLITTIVAILIVSLLMQNADALRTGFVNGVYTVFCDQMCFDLVKNAPTKGYDPKFLAMPVVKESCIDAKDYGKQMGFCSLVI